MATAPTWPTIDDVKVVEGQTAAALDAVQTFGLRYLALMEEGVTPTVKEDAPPPTFEAIGVMAAAVSLIELDVDFMNEELKRMRGFLSSAPVDALEAMGNGS
jgi:hypothetical protein